MGMTGIIGRRVRTRRRQLEMSLAEVGGRLGLSASQLSRIEKGKSAITLDFLERVAEVLQTTVADLMVEERPFEPPVHPKLVRHLANLGLRRQESLLDLLERGTLVPRPALACDAW